MDWNVFQKALVSSVVFSLVGMAVFAVGFVMLRKLLPMDMKKEIETDQNTALGIVIGSVILGLAYIIGSAIHG
jgi:putative membrane protein